MDNRKVIYYKDELNDEFSTAKIVPKVIDEKYKLYTKFVNKLKTYKQIG